MSNDNPNTLFLFNQKLIGFSEKFKFKSPVLAKIYSVVFFLAIINVFYTYFGVYKFIDKRPCSIHVSAQTSRASVALNYYENDMNFFTPQYQRTMEGKGYTGLEFPVIYYVGAICYKLFGFNEIYLRLISLIITTVGLLYFFLLSLKYTKSNWISISVISAVICSPVFIFYTPNFMPDPPSIALILASWYFLFKYKDSHQTKHLNWFIFLATLGVLLKVTGAICFVIVLVILLLDRLKFFKNNERDFIFPDKRKIVARIAIGFAIVVAWYKYSRWFPEAFGGQTFLLSPNMYQNWDGLLEVLDWMKKLWLNHYYSTESYILLGVIASFIILFVKHANRLLISITVLYIFGCIFYFLFFLNQFMHHDYYIITMLPALFFLFLTFADIINKLSEKYFYPLRIILLVVLFFNLKESFIKTRLNMYDRNSVDIFYWTDDYRAYEDLEPKLRKHGIVREDRVVSGFDNSDCGSIYLMNQLGTTFGKEAPKEQVDAMLAHPNSKYLVLNDSAKFRKMYNYDFSDKVLDVHRGLIIYKIK